MELQLRLQAPARLALLLILRLGLGLQRRRQPRLEPRLAAHRPAPLHRPAAQRAARETESNGAHRLAGPAGRGARWPGLRSRREARGRPRPRARGGAPPRAPPSTRPSRCRARAAPAPERRPRAALSTVAVGIRVGGGGARDARRAAGPRCPGLPLHPAPPPSRRPSRSRLHAPPRPPRALPPRPAAAL